MGQNVDLRVLRAEEFASFRQRNIARYAQELLFARATDTQEHALTEAQGALDEMLPQGAETPRNYLLAAESGGETVGELWCDTTEPETVFIPFQQHIGKPAVPVKAVGDPVAKGELLAQAAPDGLSANIHASIDGVVTEITPAGARLCRKEV